MQILYLNQLNNKHERNERIAGMYVLPFLLSICLSSAQILNNINKQHDSSHSNKNEMEHRANERNEYHGWKDNERRDYDRYRDEYRYERRDYNNEREKHEKLKYSNDRYYTNNNEGDNVKYNRENNIRHDDSVRTEPPDHRKLVAMARYVMHNADWASIATISTIRGIEGFPFSNVKSMVDGTINNSTGVPYFYISPLDFTAKDLYKNNRCTVMATLEETSFCRDKNYDPEDPRCTRLMLSGKMKKVYENTTEYEFGKKALFERHPSMANFPADHDFFVTKLKITMIAMVDWFGGAKFIDVHDYFAYNYTETDIMQHIITKQDAQQPIVVNI